MALDGGGGGGGGPIGSSNSFTGAAESLELVGNHCMAYSGAFGPFTDTDEHKLLSFTTGNYYSVVDFIFWRRSWEDDDIAFYVDMNGTQVLAWIGRQSEPNGANMGIPLIIPSYTQVEAYCDKQGGSAESIVGINITGRIYR